MLKSAVLLAATAASLGAQSFEGAVSMTLSGDNGRSTDVTYLVKDGKIRMEMGGGGRGMTMIMLPADKKMLMIMTAQKMYMENQMPGGDMAGHQMANPGVTVKRTGQMETIAGYQCEHITVTESNGSSDVCVAKGLGMWMAPSMGGGMRGGPPKAEGWEGGLGEGGYPLKVQKGDKTIMLVTKIEKKSLDGSLFAAPDGFTKMDMGAMMKRP